MSDGINIPKTNLCINVIAELILTADRLLRNRYLKISNSNYHIIKSNPGSNWGL